MDHIFKKRAVTAVLFAVVVLSMLILTDVSRLLLFAAVGIFSYHEMLRMAGVRPSLVWSSILFTFFIYMVLWMHTFSPAFYLVVVLVMCAFYSLTALDLFGQKRILKHPVLIGLLYPAGASALVIFDTHLNGDKNLTLWLAAISLIWATDTFAFLVGRRFGKTKLNEKLSPNKTWEGFYGGGAASLILSLIWFSASDQYPILFWLALGLVAWLGGVIGDLCQSSVKRYYNVKDSGRLLPGHGGIFDRFDSLIFVIPFVYLISILFQN